MATTPIYGLPYPSLTDTPNGPAQLQALATEVEVELVRVDAAASTLNGRVTTLENNVANPPTARLRQTSAQSIPNAAITAVNFNVEDFDTAGGHSTVTNTSRYTCPRAGKYLFSGSVTMADTAAVFRATFWRLNGTNVAGSQADTFGVAGANVPVPAQTVIISLALNDFVELGIYQEGGTQNTNVSSDIQSFMSVLYVST